MLLLFYPGQPRDWWAGAKVDHASSICHLILFKYRAGHWDGRVWIRWRKHNHAVKFPSSLEISLGN